LTALIMAFAHTYAQDNRGKKVKFFIIEIPVLWLPWAMLTMTLVSQGWGSVKTEFTGILASHLYDFLTRIYPTFGGGRNYIFTPDFVRRYIFRHTPDAARRTYGRAYRPSRPAEAQPDTSDSSTRSWTSSQDLGSWGTRGSGRRLG
jgi:Derlin-2/3